MLDSPLTVPHAPAARAGAAPSPLSCKAAGGGAATVSAWAALLKACSQAPLPVFLPNEFCTTVFHHSELGGGEVKARSAWGGELETRWIWGRGVITKLGRGLCWTRCQAPDSVASSSEQQCCWPRLGGCWGRLGGCLTGEVEEGLVPILSLETLFFFLGLRWDLGMD